MDGPIKNERDTLGNQLKWLERWLVFSGVVVVVGVFIEISSKVLKGQIDNEVIGGLLIIIGVAAEVAIARVITLKTDRIQEIADSEVAQANRAAGEAHERASNAERATAEVNLAREQLQSIVTRRTITRRLTPNEVDEFTQAMSEFSGQRFSIHRPDAPRSLSSERAVERELFGGQLTDILKASKWEETHIPFPPDFRVDIGVTIFIPVTSGATDTGYGKPSRAGQALSWNLQRLSISSEIRFLPTAKDEEFILISIGFMP